MRDPQHDFPRAFVFGLAGQVAHDLGAGSPVSGVIEQRNGHRRATQVGPPASINPPASIVPSGPT